MAKEHEKAALMPFGAFFEGRLLHKGSLKILGFP